MVGIRAVPVRAAVSHLLSLNESLRNKFLEFHNLISYHSALTPTIESQGTPSFFIESVFSKPSKFIKIIEFYYLDLLQGCNSRFSKE